MQFAVSVSSTRLSATSATRTRAAILNQLEEPEFILTLVLMFVILSVSTGSKEKGLLAGVAVGSVIALEALFAGPISGASMNPARSLAPALVSARFEHLWVYLAAPVLGAISGVGACRCILDKRCFEVPASE